jgi:hypothetical protein
MRRPLLRQTDMHLRAAYRQPMEGVAAILYRTGDDFQGMHSDREMRWLDDTLIAIVVLGQRRPFVIRERTRWVDSLAQRVPAGQDPDDLVLLPGEGDLLVMGGRCQADWLHGVPACDTPNPRISLTWRWARRSGRPDTNPGYADARQFSDRPSPARYPHPQAVSLARALTGGRSSRSPRGRPAAARQLPPWCVRGRAP